MSDFVTKSYNPFGWNRLSEPMTPSIWIRFRGQDLKLEFPGPSNPIYIESATFNVLDDQGTSSATITLADPDFVNLERIFMQALFHANSFSKENNSWYVACNWGWTFYGPKLHNPGGNDDGGAQYKMSGTHYYMLRDLSYIIDEVELRVTIDLIDVGQSVFGSGGPDGPQVKVGTIDGYAATAESSSERNTPTTGHGGDTIFSMRGNLGGHDDAMLDGREISIESPMGGGTPPADTNSEGSSVDPDKIATSNVFKGKNNWEIIQAILAAQKPTIITDAYVLNGEPENPYAETEVDPNYTKKILATNNLKDEIDSLLAEMPTFPSKEEIDEERESDPDGNLSATKHWGIKAGGELTEKHGSNLKLIFGWIPDPPTKKQKLKIDNRYRHARTFTYVPGVNAEIQAGETQILSLSYDWTSQGYWGLSLPRVYGLARNNRGEVIVVYSKDDWRKNEYDKNGISMEMIDSPPGTDSMGLTDAVDALQGVQLQFNFDTNTESNEKITTSGSNVIVNVWNHMMGQLLDISIDIPGDPFLDNRLFSAEANNKDFENLLVDLYSAYFVVKVYRMNRTGGRTLSPLFEGRYLCFEGCSHQISEGEYTTSLKLFKGY